ncbi:chemerin-like receptor 1 [Emys orbicularis]|uniref:chemerin-like receptor 1 n=1 Tax=Emys orbicularis TaxID=82168 RepID=UPI0031FD9B41
MEYLIVFQLLCGMTFLAGVPLNVYVLFVAGYRLKRTVSAVWFWNRAMADFIFIIFLPLRFIFVFNPSFDFIMRLSSIVTSLHMFSSAFLLTGLSVDRCILVACPEWARNHRTLPLAYGVVMGLWALSLGFSLRYGDISDYLVALPSIRRYFELDKGRVKATVAMQFLVGFLIPFALILISTFYIVLAAKLRRKRLIQSTKPLKILIGLIPTFFLCWLPYYVFFFLQIFDMYPLPYLQIGNTFSCVPTYFSSCLNPIFYLTMEKEFLKYRQHARNPQTTDNSGLELDE